MYQLWLSEGETGIDVRVRENALRAAQSVLPDKILLTTTAFAELASNFLFKFRLSLTNGVYIEVFSYKSLRELTRE